MRAAIGLFTLCRTVAGVVPAAATNVKDSVYICPMDPNMRSNTTDKRPKCVMIMAMVAGMGDSAEFHGVVNTARFDIPVSRRSNCSGMSCFLFQTVGVKGGQSDPPRNVQTAGS